MSTAGSGNRKHLIQLWAWPLLMVAAMSVGAVIAISQSANLTPLYWGAGTWVLAFGFVRVTQLRAQRRFGRLLLEPSPDGLLGYTRGMFSRVRTPHADLLLATSLAIQRALYGQYGRALDELDLRSWNGAPEMYRASMLQARALVHYLSRDDVAAGLRAAREAEALSVVPRFLPGAARSRSGTALYIDIGRVLCEGATPELAAALDRAAAQAKQPLDRAIRLWGAALAYAALGQEQTAASLRSQLAELAPHCAPLQQTDRLERAAPGEVAARGMYVAAPRSAGATPPADARSDQAAARSCALHPERAADVCCIRCGSFACAECARAVSEQASICAACTERYRELRARNLGRERFVRAAGLLVQVGAASLAALVLISVAVTTLLSGVALYSLISLAFTVLVLSFIWRRGRRIRQLQGNWRSELFFNALPLLLLVPVGSALGGSLLWLLRQPPFAADHAVDYQQAIRVTPELEPRSLWWPALGAFALLLLNLVLLLWAVFALTSRA